MYKKPLLSLLKCESGNFQQDKGIADTYNDIILECFHAHNVSVTSAGYKVSPINMVFDYILQPPASYKTVKDLKDDISVAIGFEVKVFTRNDEDGVFSISVPKESRSYVGLSDIISSKEFKESKAPLTIAAGIDELARNVVFDLAEAPHLLISGTTGSGKTVYLDDIILSIVYKSSPKKVKLVLIDPGADLSAYDGLPHLLFKPVSAKREAYEVIDHVRKRMDERYNRWLPEAGVRDIESYNLMHRTHMPYIVVIIDKYLEFAYEMPADFLENIKAIARKGRAAGVHLILNSQSAKAEVIDGTLKDNFPYRIAFSVSDHKESKAILDQTGAQKLLGNGDMILLKGPIRYHIQAPNVGLNEIKSVVANVIDRNGRADYLIDFNDVREPIDDNIAFVVDILEVISMFNKVDVKKIQRKMNVDYFEALDIIKFLEDHKIVTKSIGEKDRIVNQSIVDRLLVEFRHELSLLNEEVEE